jgi:hypothetical protein
MMALSPRTYSAADQPAQAGFLGFDPIRGIIA